MKFPVPSAAVKTYFLAQDVFKGETGENEFGSGGCIELYWAARAPGCRTLWCTSHYWLGSGHTYQMAYGAYI